jgi:hypothetical protein
MIRFSPSTLSLFKSCPKCFWLDLNRKVKRPRGIFPSITRGIDGAMKNSVEQDHAAGRSVAYLAEIDGASPFPDREMLAKKMRSWRTFQAQVSPGIWLSGELDDLIQFRDGSVSPWDFKSNGQEREWAEYATMYYQHQSDVYAAILSETGFMVYPNAYFTFTWPVAMDGEAMRFAHKTIGIMADASRAVDLAKEAAACLAGAEPPFMADCEYCIFFVFRTKARP